MSIWALIFGLIGVAILIATFQFNKRHTILRLQLTSGVVWAIHFVLLDALTGACMNMMMAIRNYLFDRFARSIYVFWFCIVVIVAAGVLTWNDWSSLLPLVASVISTLALWQKSPGRIRLLMLGVPPLWFSYNYINGSYPGMIGDTVTLSSILIGIYRFDIRRESPVFSTGNHATHKEYLKIAKAKK